MSIIPTVPAAWLTFAEGVVYSAYDIPDRLWGISVTADQQVAGADHEAGRRRLPVAVITVLFFQWAANVQRHRQGGRPGRSGARADVGRRRARELDEAPCRPTRPHAAAAHRGDRAVAAASLSGRADHATADAWSSRSDAPVGSQLGRRPRSRAAPDVRDRLRARRASRTGRRGRSSRRTPRPRHRGRVQLGQRAAPRRTGPASRCRGHGTPITAPPSRSPVAAALGGPAGG